MREMDGWHFVGYYGIIYLFSLLIMLISFIPFIHQFIEPIMGLIFPIAKNSSPLKVILVMSGMYWAMVLFYTLVIQKIKLRF